MSADSPVAASAAPSEGTLAIGRYDQEALKSLRNLVEGHLQVVLKKVESDRSLLASSTPLDFFDEAWIDEFLALSDDLWTGGIDLISTLFGTNLGVPLAPRATVMEMARVAIEEAKQKYQDLIVALTEKHAYSMTRKPTILGEFNVGGVVQMGDVRELLVRLGGGTTDPTVTLMGGITTGTTMQDYLGESGVNTNEKIWLYGFEEQPRRVFNGHLQMDGLVFENWDDNGLIVAPQDRWLRRNYYAPGDHWGCACVVAPYYPNLGDPFSI